MPAEHAEGLDDMMMGNVSEGVAESDEVFAERVRQTQAKIQKIRKDEKKSKNFDDQLAKIIPGFSPLVLDVVIFCIDFEVPSLTVLAIISLINDESGRICWEVFDKYIEERADFSGAHLPAKVDEKISYWWTFIYGSDHMSMTTKLSDLRTDTVFIKKFSHYLTQILLRFLKEEKVEEFDENHLKGLLAKYQTGLFENPEKAS